MTEQKVRKFKLVDRDGFINRNPRNKVIMNLYMDNGMFEGVVDEDGDLVPVVTGDGDILISENEFEYFEEVTEVPSDQGKWYGVGIPPVGTICKAYHNKSGKYHEVEIIKTRNNGVYEVAACMKVNDFMVFWSSNFGPVEEKTWQEKVSEEFDIEYTTSGDFKFNHFMEQDRLIEMAKRIIELSEGEK